MLNSFTTLISPEVTSIAIGGFDGIHLAHQEIIEKLDGSAALLVVRKHKAILTNNNRDKFTKAKIIKLEFEDIKDMNCQEFTELLSFIFPNLRKIVIGYDFCYGKNRSCGIENLQKSDFVVEVVNQINYKNEAVHSFKIKNFLREGDVKRANIFLSRIYEVEGKVIKGQGIGAKELVATINLEVNDFLLPKDGVYVTKSLVDGILYKSVSFIGHRQSSDGNFAVETHIIEKNIEVKSDTVTIYFYDYLRENRKFESLETLKKQIQKDIEEVKLFAF